MNRHEECLVTLTIKIRTIFYEYTWVCIYSNYGIYPCRTRVYICVRFACHDAITDDRVVFVSKNILAHLQQQLGYNQIRCVAVFFAAKNGMRHKFSIFDACVKSHAFIRTRDLILNGSTE